MSALAVPAMNPGFGRRRQWQAFGSALGLELVLIAAVVTWLATSPAKPAEMVVPLVIETVQPKALEKIPEPEKPTPSPQKPMLKPTLAPTPRAQPSPPEAPAPAAAPVQQPVVAAAPAVSPAQVAPAAPPTVAATAAVDPAPAYNARLSAAVQAVFQVPAAAEALGFKGRTRVEFSLRDGVVSAIRVVQTSGLGAADRAAVKAVQSAAYPPPPQALQGRDGTYQIWVACL